MALTPFARTQLYWAVLLIALFAMLELARDFNLAVFYIIVTVAYFCYFHPNTRRPHPYWIIDVILGLGGVYAFFRFIWP